jgi:hypothetical protein
MTILDFIDSDLIAKTRGSIDIFIGRDEHGFFTRVVPCGGMAPSRTFRNASVHTQETMAAGYASDIARATGRKITVHGVG